MADGRDHVLTEAAGITAGIWCASPATHVGHELIAAGMLILAGGGRGVPLDYAELERWTRVGYERGTKGTSWRALKLAGQMVTNVWPESPTFDRAPWQDTGMPCRGRGAA